MLSKSFKPAKCKTSLKLAVARIKLLRNKREVQVKQMRRELAQLLESGQEQTARIRVEHVIREEKTMSAYELIELYCELIVARLPIIESQKSCPIDLKEAVSSVIFASPRCADLPELMDIRKHFAAKYGKEFINSALEVRPDCGVSRLVVEKLSARAPDIETKVKTLTAIAQEHNVKWDSEKIEEELKKPHDDLLSGPTAFASASKMPMEPSNVKPSPAPIQTNELSGKMPQNDTANRTTSSTTFSETNTRTGTSVPFTSQSESRPSESRSLGGEVKDSYYREENSPLNQPTWRMEFQDATSAAQAAAESAERASMAARAAAELASRGNISRQNSTGSNESPSYNKKYERPEKLRVFLGEDIADESVPKVNDELKSYQGLKAEAENLQQDERMQGISRREAARTSNNDYSMGRRPLGQSSPHSIQGFVNDDILDANFHKDVVEEYSRAERISSESEPVELNRPNIKHENVEYSRNVNPSEAASPHYVTGHEKFWNSDIYKHENDGETFRTDAGANSPGSNHEKLTSNDSFAVVFDNYGSDAEDNNSVFGRNRGNVLDSYQGKELPSFQSNIDPFSLDQNRSGSFAKHSSSQLHLFTESQPEEHSEIMTKVTFPSQSNESVPPAFDVSDGESTESEVEVAISPHKEAMKPSNPLHEQERSMSSSFSDESTRESKHTCIGETMEVKETIRNSGAYDKNTETDLYAADKFYRSSGSNSLPSSQTSPRNDKTPRNFNVPVGGSGYSSSDEEEPAPLHLTRRQPTRETDDKEKSRMPSMHLGTEGSELSNEFGDESAQGINFGKLTGGFKHRGFPHPQYVRSTAADASQLSKQTSDTASISEKLIVSDVDKQSASFKVADSERYNQESRPKAYTSKSRTSGASVDSHSDTAEGLPARYSAEDTSDMDERRVLSRKTKIAEDVGAAAPESYYGRGYKEVSSNFRGAYYDPDSNEQTRYTVDTRRYSDSASAPRKQSLDASPEVEKLNVSLPDKKYASSEVSNLDQYDQKPHIKPNKESISRMTYLDSDGSEAKLGSDYAAGSRVKLSRRTRDVPPESKKSSPSITEPLPNTTYDAVIIQGKGSSKPVRSNPSVVQPSVAPTQMSSTCEESPKSKESSPSIAEPLPNTTYDAIIVHGKGSSKPVRSNPSVVQPSAAPTRMPSTCEESPKSQLNPTENIIPRNDGYTKSSGSGEESVSCESSLRKASHAHPKLPDYESLAAHFHSLRSNRR